MGVTEGDLSIDVDVMLENCTIPFCWYPCMDIHVCTLYCFKKNLHASRPSELV